jgi:hypothetical protein
MESLKHSAGKILVLPAECFKRGTGLQTYWFEYAVTLTVLVSVAALSGKGIVEWIGVAAVFFGFAHMSVADRLREREERRARDGEVVHVLCYPKLGRYYVLKEICWFAYFLLLGAWSALAGVVLFLLYGPWRTLWRTYHPLNS